MGVAEGGVGGYQQLVRREVMRGKFRDSLDHPAPFTPGQPTRVAWSMNDIFHTFKKGHRLMVQLRSSWFPLMDRKPQVFMDINQAEATDYQKATHTVFHDAARPNTLGAEACEAQFPFSGQVEIDESYFGHHRVRGKRGRGAGGKTIVFGILKRAGKVFTEVVPNCSKAALLPLIRGHVKRRSTIHSDGWKAYEGLVDMGFQKHRRVNHGQNEFARGKSHINGIESFWSYAKRRLAQFNGIHKVTFYLHLKECEYRFNHRQEDLYQSILKRLRSHPI